MNKFQRPFMDYDALIRYTGEGKVQINPRTGNRQEIYSSIDVAKVIEKAGGVAKVAELLGVEEIDIEHWIYDHYIPTRYVEQLHKLTGWSIESMQYLGFYESWKTMPDFPYR